MLGYKFVWKDPSTGELVSPVLTMIRDNPQDWGGAPRTVWVPGEWQEIDPEFEHLVDEMTRGVFHVLANPESARDFAASEWGELDRPNVLLYRCEVDRLVWWSLKYRRVAPEHADRWFVKRCRLVGDPIPIEWGEYSIRLPEGE